jgi:hypothetical protein
MGGRRPSRVSSPVRPLRHIVRYSRPPPRPQVLSKPFDMGDLVDGILEARRQQQQHQQQAVSPPKPSPPLQPGAPPHAGAPAGAGAAGGPLPVAGPERQVDDAEGEGPGRRG